MENNKRILPVRTIQNVQYYVIAAGQPCTNKTCHSHLFTKCEVCGRIKMEGESLVPIPGMKNPFINFL